MISVCFQGKLFNITVIQVCAPTSNAEEAEVEQFYEELQDLLELTPQKDVLFITGDWNVKVGSQKTPRADLLQNGLVGSPCSPRDSQEASPTPQFKSISSSALRRKWQPTPVFLPGESQGQGSLVGCRLWSRTESDTTEAT